MNPTPPFQVSFQLDLGQVLLKGIKLLVEQIT
jgi:hypothetical protein